LPAPAWASGLLLSLLYSGKYFFHPLAEGLIDSCFLFAKIILEVKRAKSMKKIIHISDLHVGYKDFRERFKIIADNLILEKGDKADQYVIVITGDLVDRPHTKKRDNYKDVKDILDYLKQSGFKHILVVPGNHDYGSGSKGNKKFVPLFKEIFFNGEAEYPKLDIIGDIAFIGLDSMAEELHWYDNLWSQGELGKKQLKRLKILLEEEKTRSCKKRVIYLHHHPFGWRPLHELKDSRKLKVVLTQARKKDISIDAILFGHNHQGKAHNGRWGIERCYDAGTTTLKERPRYLSWAVWFKTQSSTRVINLGKKANTDYVLSLL
jgi:3',5'-cyclic AMP phosphodiesterase CpdA